MYDMSITLESYLITEDDWAMEGFSDMKEKITNSKVWNSKIVQAIIRAFTAVINFFKEIINKIKGLFKKNKDNKDEGSKPLSQASLTHKETLGLPAPANSPDALPKSRTGAISGDRAKQLNAPSGKTMLNAPQGRTMLRDFMGIYNAATTYNNKHLAKLVAELNQTMSNYMSIKASYRSAGKDAASNTIASFKSAEDKLDSAIEKFDNSKVSLNLLPDQDRNQIISYAQKLASTIINGTEASLKKFESTLKGMQNTAERGGINTKLVNTYLPVIQHGLSKTMSVGRVVNEMLGQ